MEEQSTKTVITPGASVFYRATIALPAVRHCRLT
jgi:hypothetical protein